MASCSNRRPRAEDIPPGETDRGTIRGGLWRRLRAGLLTCVLLTVAVAMLLAVRANTTFHRSIEGLPMSKETRTYCLGRGSLTLPADIDFSFYDPFVKYYRHTGISIERVNKERTLAVLKQRAEDIKTHFLGRSKFLPKEISLVMQQSGAIQDGEWWFAYQETLRENVNYVTGSGILLLSDRLITFDHLPNVPVPVSAADREAIEAHMKAMMASVRRLEPGKMPDEPALCFGDGYFALPEEADETIGGNLSLFFPAGIGYGGVNVEVAKQTVFPANYWVSPLAALPSGIAELALHGIAVIPVAVGHRAVDGLDGEERVVAMSGPGISRDFLWKCQGQASGAPDVEFYGKTWTAENATAQDLAWNLVLDNWSFHR